MYRVYLVAHGSYERKYELFLDDLPWSRVWNEGHTGQVSVQLSVLERSPELRRVNLWPLENWLVVEWNGSVVYAAMITKQVYNRRTERLTLSYADIWWFWSRRYVLSNRTSSLGQSSFNWTNITYRTLAIRAVKRGIEGTGPLLWALPIVFPSEGPSGDLDRRVYGYSLEAVEDVLNEAMEAGDLNIDFRPRWSTAGTLEWVMEINRAGNQVEYDLDATETPVTDFQYIIDGTQLANTVYGVGEGSEVDTKFHVSTNVNPSQYMALEGIYSGKRVDTHQRLQTLVAERWRAFNQMRRQINMTVRAEGPPSVAALRLGDTVRWRTLDDHFVTEGWTDQTLIQISGSLEPEVGLALSEFWTGM